MKGMTHKEMSTKAGIGLAAYALASLIIYFVPIFHAMPELEKEPLRLFLGVVIDWLRRFILIRFSYLKASDGKNILQKRL